MASSDNKRIAKNTLILYIRMFFMMAVSLYTSRVVLNALGIEDYGVYNAVGGFVALFGIISSSLSAAISRFLTYELGSGNKAKLTQIFSSSVIIQIAIALIIVLLVETFGVWFLNTKMNIPQGQMVAANWVLQFSVITFAVNLISVPFTAAIIAHEKMSAFAFISILKALGQLGIAFLIIISPISRLITYSMLLCVLAIVIRMIYNIYCRRHFEECRFKLKYDKGIAREIFSFAGWNFIGAGSGILRDQGVNILLNIFCGPAVNAARGVAMQVSSAITQFTSSFTVSLNPQITKQYAQRDRRGWSDLVFRGARFACYLYLIPAIPILLETPQILSWWLKIVPGYASIFVQLIIVYVFIETISHTLVTLMLATGNIRNYQIIVGGCQMLNFPVAYALLKLGFPPQSTIVGTIVIALLCLVLRLIMLRRMVNLDVGAFIGSVFFKILLVSVCSAVLPIFVLSQMESGIVRVVTVAITSMAFTSITVLAIGCTSHERMMLLQQAKKFIRR